MNDAVIVVFAIGSATRVADFDAGIVESLSVMTMLAATVTVALSRPMHFPLSLMMALRPLRLFLRLVKSVEHSLLTI